MPARIAEAFEIEGGDAHGDLGRRLKLRQASLAALVRTGAVGHGVEIVEWHGSRALDAGSSEDLVWL